MIVYISGPYTKGDVAKNVNEAMWAGLIVLDHGHTPLVPHLSHFMHLLSQRPWDKWIEMDRKLVEISDELIRLDGDSKGADVEVALAVSLKIPVYQGMQKWLERSE